MCAWSSDVTCWIVNDYGIVMIKWLFVSHLFEQAGNLLWVGCHSFWCGDCAWLALLVGPLGCFVPSGASVWAKARLNDVETLQIVHIVNDPDAQNQLDHKRSSCVFVAQRWSYGWGRWPWSAWLRHLSYISGSGLNHLSIQCMREPEREGRVEGREWTARVWTVHTMWWSWQESMISTGRGNGLQGCEQVIPCGNPDKRAWSALVGH